MEGNDLGSHWSMKFVVIGEPTIWIPPKESPRGRLGLRRRQLTAEDYELNRSMVAWMVNVGRHRSIPIEVWSFLPEEVFDPLSDQLERFAGQVLVGQHRWDTEADAVMELRVDPAIHTVYDADSDRVDRLWGMRGHRVLAGGPPTS